MHLECINQIKEANMAFKDNQFIKVLQDNGCPDDIIADIVDSRVDNLLDRTRGSNFWLPMAYELSRVHQKGMKHLVEVLHWIIPICGHPIRSLEYMFDLVIKSGRKFDEYTADLFIDDAVTAAVSRGLFVKIPNQGDENKLDIAAYAIFKDWARRGSRTIINSAVSNQAYGDKFHVDQADKIFDQWLKVGLVEKVSGRDDFRFRSCAADAVLTCMDAVGDKYNAFSHNWQHSVRKCWLEKLALQLVMDSENGKILLAMEKVKKTSDKKKPEKPKNSMPPMKWHPLEVADDDYEEKEIKPVAPAPEPIIISTTPKVVKPVQKVPTVEVFIPKPVERVEIHEKVKVENTKVPEESPVEEDSFDVAMHLFETIVQKYSEGWSRDDEKKKKLITMAKTASILMEL